MSNGRIKQQNDTEARKPNDKPVCTVCGEVVYRKLTVHCPGNSQAFNAILKGEPHHAAWRNLPCMVCGADMGCPRCSGIARELLCVAQCGEGASYKHDNAHWGSPEALAEHGQLILDPVVRKEAMLYLHRVVERIGQRR